ncbi:MAG: S-layer homology domain-containing protein [Proteobacteria bacterium]|nr:S-layer homology domain-containing protein [Pseudomonadota bacterium]
MRRVGYVLGALLLLMGVMAPAIAQQPFADVPLDHWAYNAVNRLAEAGLLEGYPDGTFRGRQSLTRYEFAQAIARAMDRLEQMGGVQGPPGPAGPAGPPAVAGGLTPEQLVLLDRLSKEFAPELSALRADLDSLTSRVEDLEAAPAAAAPTITVSGDISWRVGLYGTSLGVEDVETTGYPFPGALADAGEYLISDGTPAIAHGTAFLGVPYGGINLPDYNTGSGLWTDDPAYPGGPTFFRSIPISDALKDAYKASDFMSMKTRVNFSGALAPNTDVMVQLLAGPENNYTGNIYSHYQPGSPATTLTGNGVMDTVTIDQAYFLYRTNVFVPAELTVGKQYFSRGLGLLADNSQDAIKAFRIDWNTGDSVSWGALWGAISFYTPMTFGLPQLAGSVPREASGQDNYNLYYLDWMVTDTWCLGANWLDSGFNREQGWSANLMGDLYGLDFYGEYAQLTSWPTGDDFADLNANGIQDTEEVSLDESDTAWMVGLRWTSEPVCITGEYGEVDAGYAFSVPGGGWSAIPSLRGVSLLPVSDDFTLNLPLSALHPNAEVDPHDINWIDRSLFLDATNIARGWHVNVTFPDLLGDDTPVSVSYRDGDAYSGRYLSWLYFGGTSSGIAEPSKWTDADPIWVVKVSRQLNESVSANLLYGRREVDNVMSTQQVPASAVGPTAYAENDPIQVIRGEICVAF